MFNNKTDWDEKRNFISGKITILEYEKEHRLFNLPFFNKEAWRPIDNFIFGIPEKKLSTVKP